MQYVNYIKYAIILALVCAGIWFIKDYIDKKEFKQDTITNQLYQDKFDSLRVSYTVLADKQMINALKQNNEYKKLLKESNIKLGRVTSFMQSVLKYRDTTIVETDLSPVLDAINLKKNISVPFVDSTKCMTIKGNVDLIGGFMTLNITDRVFNNKTSIIAYWERREWKFLGIKTRFLGKKQGTAKVIDECGESRTINIEKK